MCLAVIALGVRRDHPVIIAANRDEFLHRPALALAPWHEDGRIRGGRDLEGGTWSAFHEDGRWGLITNVRAPHIKRHGAPSRGTLIKDFLLNEDQPKDFLLSLGDINRYEPFNLVLGFGAEAYRINSIDRKLNAVDIGIHTLSNDNLNTPWPKAEATRQAVSRNFGSDVVDVESLILPLTDRTMYPDEVLPSTGVPLEWERILSAAFVDAPGYGTCCSTVALLNRSGSWQLKERVWNQIN